MCWKRTDSAAAALFIWRTETLGLLTRRCEKVRIFRICQFYWQFLEIWAFYVGMTHKNGKINEKYVAFVEEKGYKYI